MKNDELQTINDELKARSDTNVTNRTHRDPSLRGVAREVRMRDEAISRITINHQTLPT